MRLHSCDEILPRGPPTSDMLRGGTVNWSLASDNGCIEAIAQHYTVSKHASGSGAHGSVIRLDEIGNYQRQIAVKVIPYEIDPEDPAYAVGILQRDASRELFIACQLNAVTQETPVFTKTLGWLICDTLPPKWTRFMRHTQYANVEKRSYMLIFMESNPFTLMTDSLVFEEEDYVTMIFLLFHAIYIGRKELGFKHNDLHERNFMFASSLSEDPKIPIVIENQRFEVSLSIGHFPKIIDYGMSVTATAFDGVRSRRNDLVFIMDALEKRSVERQESFPIIPGLDQLYEATLDGEWEPIAAFLLENAAFETIRSSSKRLKLVRERLCFFCGSPASVQWNNNDDRVFCGHGCGLKLSKIAAFI